MGWLRGGAHTSGGWHEVQGRRGRTAGRRPGSAGQTDPAVISTVQSVADVTGASCTDSSVNTLTSCGDTDDPWTQGAVNQLRATSSDQACRSVGLSAPSIGTSSALQNAEVFLPESSGSTAFVGGGWEVVVDRTFIDVLPQMNEDEPITPRCRSAPGDLGPYSVHERVAADCSHSSGALSPRSFAEKKCVENENSCAGSDDSMPPIVQKSVVEAVQGEMDPDETHSDNDNEGDGGNDTTDDGPNVETLWRLLQERDEEIRLLKKAVESAQRIPKEQGRSAQETKAEKEINTLRQRNSTLEKALSKQEAEMKKRSAETSKIKDALAIKEAEVAEKDLRLKELQDLRETELAKQENPQTTVLDNVIEISARHALEDVELKVTVPPDATFRDVKKAIANRVGSDDILVKGRLLKKQKGAYLAHQDKAKVGNVREVLVLGVELEALDSQKPVAEECQEKNDSKSIEGLEARIGELEALVSKKDSVLRGVLGELKRLRDEKAQTKEEIQKQDEKPETLASNVAKASSNERSLLPVVDVAKLAKADKSRNYGMDGVPMASKPCSNQRPPLPVVDVARLTQERHLRATLPPKSTMWKALLASRAKLNLHKSDGDVEVSSERGSSSSKLDDNHSWSSPEIPRGSGNGEETSVGEQKPVVVKGFLERLAMLDACTEVAEASSCKSVQSDTTVNSEGVDGQSESFVSEQMGVHQEPSANNDDSEQSQFSISSFVRDYFNVDAQKHRMKEGIAASKFINDHTYSGVSNAETLTVSSGDEPTLGQVSELDSEIDFAATVYSKDLGDESFAGDLVISDGTQTGEHGIARCIAADDQYNSPQDPVLRAHKGDRDTRPQHCKVGFASKVAARAARKEAQTRARELAMASSVYADTPTSSSSQGKTAPIRGIPISTGIRPMWRLNNSVDVGL